MTNLEEWYAQKASQEIIVAEYRRRLRGAEAEALRIVEAIRVTMEEYANAKGVLDATSD